MVVPDAGASVTARLPSTVVVMPTLPIVTALALVVPRFRVVAVAVSSPALRRVPWIVVVTPVLPIVIALALVVPIPSAVAVAVSTRGVSKLVSERTEPDSHKLPVCREAVFCKKSDAVLPPSIPAFSAYGTDESRFIGNISPSPAQDANGVQLTLVLPMLMLSQSVSWFQSILLPNGLIEPSCTDM